MCGLLAPRPIWSRTTPAGGRYLEAEPETGVGQQMDAALHHLLGDDEVGRQLGFNVGTAEIFSVLTLGGRGNLCRDHKDRHRPAEQGKV